MRSRVPRLWGYREKEIDEEKEVELTDCGDSRCVGGYRRCDS
jgi:hypothetical protein